MSNIIQKVSAFFRVGRARYLAGKDLDHNKYYEYPPLDGNTDPRRTRRLVRFREHKELGEYDQSTLPPQWLMWLRHTRKSAPTIEELSKDRERIAITQHNVRILEQRDAQRRLELEQKAQDAMKERQLIEQEYYSPNKQRRDGKTTAVPTSTVTDSKAQEEAAHRVPFEQQKDAETTYQQRTVDMEVWEASRRRMEEKQGKANESMDDAIQARAERRANLDAKEMERQRARKVMNQSPLSAFDVSIEGQKSHTSPQENARNQLNPRFGRAAGPGDEWSPSEWQPKPARR
ncbi:uncharacterized protein FA14DRAFT_160726 [Meira miltonrushii]|uniref:Uncharacterized protein n=1 Tax=Meira miltonrushii TaxID=1280837 RepID=A0A316VDV6_9BASI|nr:uncharacterized protein FA14DRAFT_160726 [Meira miltonrushii]PWN35680.1 hypothetical protein FA14DRAFT_160726 [Meira miltonrushii]